MICSTQLEKSSMMHTNKPHAGAVLPSLPVDNLDSEIVDISKQTGTTGTARRQRN